MIRVLWIGMPAEHGMTQKGKWSVNDYAMDLSDAELFTLSRIYDAFVLSTSADRYTLRRSIKRFKASAPRAVTIGLEPLPSAEREKQFFEAGGDEYIPYPRSAHRELVRLRIERLVLQDFSGESILRGMFRIEPEEHTVYVGGEAVRLQPDVFNVFYLLFLKRDRLVSSAELLCSMYENPEYVSDSGTKNAVRVIRNSIDRRFGIETIKTFKSKGYRFVYNL